MPLTVNESKDVIIKMFRLVLAVSSKNDGEASKAFESIVHTIMTDDDPMPPLESWTEKQTYVTATNDGVDLVIREEPAARQEPAAARQEPALTINTPRSYDYPRAQPATPCSDIEGNNADDELESDEIGVEAVELNDEGAVEEEEEEAVEEEEEEEAVEEEVALNLEPVRIRKIIYWKDTDSGDLYQYLPDDEVGDKVGAYVNGVPVLL